MSRINYPTKLASCGTQTACRAVRLLGRFDRCANSHFLHPPQAAVVAIAYKGEVLWLLLTTSSEGNQSAAGVHPSQHSAAQGALQYGKEEGQRFHVIMHCPALSPSAGSAKNYELRVRMGSRY